MVEFKYECILKIDTKDKVGQDELYKLLLPEASKTSRAVVEFNKEGNQVVIVITAKDSVVLRAVLNSLTRLLSIWDGLNDELK
ncbi:hypothetical protein J7J26_01365 [Candidatus Micrarchaeota archaeon]|nr:hypothetical protein [Candidatus Micrarchaeota archaeon]